MILLSCSPKWLARFTPFFPPAERLHAGVQHRLFFAQTEYCDNLLFRRRAALEALEQRLLGANRTIGQPTKLTIIFGRRITRRHHGKLQSVIEDLNLPNPVLRSQGSDRNDPSFPPLSAAAQRLPDLRALPQVVRKSLRSAHRWHFAALRR